MIFTQTIRNLRKMRLARIAVQGTDKARHLLWVIRGDVGMDESRYEEQVCFCLRFP